MEYLIKASALLAIFYLFYKFILQKETFFQSNRLFLLSGLAIAILAPFIIIPIYVEQTAIALPEFSNAAIISPLEVQNTIDWFLIITMIYIAGVVFFTGKSIFSMLSLAKIMFFKSKNKIDGLYFLKSDINSSPFSFFNHIVYNPNLFQQNELEQILTHEKVHAHQWHSVDILISELITIAFWFNPFSWLYKKELEQNLEFIADAISQEKTSCKKSYQQLLLKTTISKNQLALTNNFYNSLIKKRIIMLHKTRSKNTSQWKIAFILPLIIAFVFTFNTKMIAQKTKTDKQQIYELDEDLQIIIINKDSKDESIKNIIEDFSKEGITIKIKGIKRNSNGEITAIKIDASSSNSNANFASSSDEPIQPIKIAIKNNGESISIGNSNTHNMKGDYMFISKDGSHQVHSNGKGSQQFVFISDDNDNEEETHKTIEIKEDGENVSIINKDGNEEIHEISEDGNHHVIKIKKGDGDGDENIWITKKETTKVEVTGDDNDDHQMIFISDNDSKSKPLIFVDGKESSTNLDDLDPNKIVSVNVLKGENAIKKYGEKAKNGVLEITTKKD